MKQSVQIEDIATKLLAYVTVKKVLRDGHVKE